MDMTERGSDCSENLRLASCIDLYIEHETAANLEHLRLYKYSDLILAIYERSR
jgi:hypothetical protein